MKHETYKLMLTKSQSAISHEQLENITKLLEIFSQKDYVITIEPTPLNPICRFTTSIIILKRSLEEAAPLSDEITKLLETNGEKVTKVETYLIWDEPTKHFYYDFEN
jgi:hypothetical protein